MSGLPHRLGERVEVHHHDVDRLHPVLGQLGKVVRLVTARQEGGEDVRVKGLDAAAQDLRRVGQVGDRVDLDPVLAQVAARAIGGVALDAGLFQAAGELDDAFTVRDGEESAQSTSSVVRAGGVEGTDDTAW